MKENIKYPEINIQCENINFQENIFHMKWCPTMDLLATVNTSYRLTIYRSTWVDEKFVLQKIWSINSTLCQTSIEWRPDGKIIAVGYTDGSLKLIDVETAQIAYSLPYFTKNSYITSMNWIEEIDNNQKTSKILNASVTSLHNLFPALSKIPNSQPFNMTLYTGEIFSNNSKLGTSFLSEKIGNDDNKLDILLLCDNKGHLHMSVFGLFYLGTISLSRHTNYIVKNPYIVSSYISNDLHYISLIVISANSKDDILSGKIDNDLYSSNNSSSINVNELGKKYKMYKFTFDTAIIYKKKKKIKALAMKFGNVIAHLNYIYSGIKNMKAEYEGKMKTMDKNIKAYKNILEDFAIFTPPKTEFIITLTTGLPTQSIRHYISNELKERGLKNIERTADVTYGNIQKLIIEYILPGCERLVYHLTDILGFCKWDQYFNSLGVSEQDIKSLILLTGSLIGMVEEISIRIKRIRKNSKAFFKWLQELLNSITDEEAKPPIVEDIDGILDFLNVLFDKDDNFLDMYFADFNTEDKESQNDESNDEKNKNKSSKNLNPLETLFDFYYMNYMKNKTKKKDMNSLVSKFENWEDFIYQNENEINNNNNSNSNNNNSFDNQYSNFDIFMDANDDNSNRDIGNSSFDFLSENSNILNKDSIYNSGRKLSDEDIQNSPKKQCISMDIENSLLFKKNDNSMDDDDIKNKDEVEKEKIQRNKKKRSCNEIFDASENDSIPSMGYKYQSKRPKPIPSMKLYTDNPFKYTFLKHSAKFKGISLMSLFLELINKGRDVLFMPSRVIGQSFNLIYSFTINHDNQAFQSALITNKIKFDEAIKNGDIFNNNSSSNEISVGHNDRINVKNLICKCYCSKNSNHHYTSFYLHDKNKKNFKSYLYIYKFNMSSYDDNQNNNDNNENGDYKTKLEITAIRVNENDRIIDFEFYNDKYLLCLMEHNNENEDRGICRIGWVNYYKSKFVSLSPLIFKNQNVQLNNFLELSRTKAHNIHLHNSVLLKSIKPQYLRISLKRGLLCVMDKNNRNICVFTIENND